MNLTNNFTLEELTASPYALRNGLNNQPTDHEVLINLQVLAEGLERVRGVIDCPIHVTSGYRSPKVNAGVGGAKTSAHMRGLAADILVANIAPKALCKIIEANKDVILFDQLIYEGTWTHIAFAEDAEPRLQVLTALFKPGKIVEYVKGVV